MKKKAFLFSALYYPNVGGVENSLKEFSLVLMDRGYEVIIVTSNRDLVSGNILSENVEIEGVRVIRCNYPYGKFGFFYFLKELHRKIKDLNVTDSDFILMRSHLPVLAAKTVGLKKINYLAPSVYLHQEKLSWTYFFSSRLFPYVVNSFTQFIAFISSNVYVFSESMQRQVKSSSLGLSTSVLVRPGVSNIRFFPVTKNEKNIIRDKLGLKQTKRYLLCIGRISEIKQFDLAIKAMNHLDESYHLIIVGSGPELDNLKILVERENLRHKVSFYPFTNKIDLYYKAADLYLMTSRYESFGQVLLEATVCELPIIAFSKSSGVNTSVSEIYNGFEYLLKESNEQSPLSLSNTIADYDCDLEKFKQEVSRFRENYSWESTLKTIMYGEEQDL